MSYWRDDYCEGCDRIDPTEANNIEDEAVDRFREYLHKQFAEEYNIFIKEKENLAEREKELNQKRLNLAQKELELEVTQKNVEKYINDCLAKKEKEIVREYAQKFFGIHVPGNTVYFYDIEGEYTDCPYCNGTGIIEHKCESTGELLQIKCNKCDSNHKGKIINKYSYTIYEGKIIKSYIKIYSDMDENALRVFAEGSDSCETPVVTVQYVNKFGATKERNYWYNHNTELFISRDECEKGVIKEIEKLNKKLNK